MIQLPRLYCIVHSASFPSTAELVHFSTELVGAGCTLVQYRNKNDSARLMLEQARELKQQLGSSARLIMNDRADLCLAADFDGAHVGQDDLSPESVRRIIGPDRWLGVSTHNPEQLRDADLTSADYLAIGPVFATSSKDKAIGGITRANAASVIDAGADCIGVISDLLREPRKSAEEFLRILR